MANFATMLKDEISRISRKEIRKEILALRKASVTQRHAIAGLKRQIQELERGLSAVAKQKKPKPAVNASATPMRFVAKGLVSLRARLGLSGADLGRLLSVSPQTIYNWEQKKTTPGRAQLTALGEVRSLGKREAQKRLEALAER